MAEAQSPAHHSGLPWHKLLNLPHSVQQDLRSEQREGLATSPGIPQDAEQHVIAFAASQVIYTSLLYCPAVAWGQALTSLQGWVIAVKAEGRRRGKRWIPVVAPLSDVARLLQGFPHS